jgi:hypothetical protein
MQDPDYMKYRIMKEMHWTWRALKETPAEVVFKIIRWLNTESAATPNRRSLDG